MDNNEINQIDKGKAKEDFIYFILAIVILVGIPIAIVAGIILWLISIF